MFFHSGNDPSACLHSWEPNWWEPERAYCRLCGSFEALVVIKKLLPSIQYRDPGDESET